MSKVELPTDGKATAWECTNLDCSARNEVEGDPIDAEVVVAPGHRAGEAVGAANATAVGDSDSADAGDKQG